MKAPIISGLAVTAALMSAAALSAAPPTPSQDAGSINNIINSSNPYTVSHEGFWKFRSTKITKPYGEQDVLELAQGKHVDSNGCKVLWVGAGGVMYCFSTLAHRETFLRAPDSYAQQAYNFTHPGH